MADLIERLPSGELRIHLHQGQAKALRSTRRVIGIIAGTQSGKTSFAPLWLWNEIKQRGPGDYGFIGPTFQLLHKKAIPELRSLFEDTLALGTYKTSPVQCFTFSRSGIQRTLGEDPGKPITIYLGYAENSESLESATYKAAVLDEAGQKAFKRESWEAIQRRLAINRGRCLLATTPYFLGGWLKTEIIDRYHAGDPNVDLIQFASTMNPAFPIEAYEEAQRTLPKWRFDMMYRGVMSRPAGMIYDIFGDAQKVKRFELPAEWKRHLGLDFGGVHTAALFLAEDPATKILYVYREYLAGGKVAAEHAKALLPPGPRPLAVGGSKSEDQWRDEFSAAGLPIKPPDQPSVEVGIDRVYAAFKSGKLFVFDDLTGLIGELERYSRVVGPDGEVTEAIQDKSTFHRLDALRYIVGYLRRPDQKVRTAQLPW